jgi:ribose transport system ATP-binding protein
VLVLDEPTSTLGRRDVEKLFALIARLKANDHSMSYISHFIEEVRAGCDRIVVLRDGRVAGGGPSTMTPAEIVRLMVRTRRGGAFSAHATTSPAKRFFRLTRSTRAVPPSPSIVERFSASPA